MKEKILNNSSPDLTSEPPAKKKKQSIACDNCRKTKQRCDGNSPCIRCQTKSKSCSYSPTSVRGKRKLSELELVKGEQTTITSNINLVTSSVERKYLDAYFSYLKPPMLYHGVGYDSLLNVQANDAKTLQFDIAMATAARSFGDKITSMNFEKKARHLAADLFDTFTLDTARAFSMLSYHYWGHDNHLSQHYRDLTVSICKRLQGMYATSNDTHLKSQVFLTKFSSFCMDVYDAPPNSNTPPLSQLLTEDQKFVDVSQFSSLLRKIPQIYEIINRCYMPGQFPCVRTGNLTLEKAHFFLERLNDGFSDHCVLKELPEAAKFCCSHVLVLKALVCFCSGQNDKAVEYIREVVSFFAEQKDFLRFAPPFFIHTFHILFSLCYQLQQLELANQVTSLQRYISEILPLGKPLLDTNVEMLNSLNSMNSVHQAFAVQNPQNTNANDMNQFNLLEEFFENNNISFSDNEFSMEDLLDSSSTAQLDDPFKNFNFNFDSTSSKSFNTPLKISFDHFRNLPPHSFDHAMLKTSGTCFELTRSNDATKPLEVNPNTQPIQDFLNLSSPSFY